MYISINYVDINIYRLTMECNAPLSMFIWERAQYQMTILLVYLKRLSQIKRSWKTNKNAVMGVFAPFNGSWSLLRNDHSSSLNRMNSTLNTKFSRVQM